MTNNTSLLLIIYYSEYNTGFQSKYKEKYIGEHCMSLIQFFAGKYIYEQDER